jgi:hypothetical protein
MRGNLPDFETQSGCSVRSKVIGESDHQRYSEVVGFTAFTARPIRLSLH